MSKKSILLLLAVFVTPGVQSDSKAPPIRGDYKPSAVTERVYVIHGAKGFPSKENQGFMNNPAFVLTGKGVVIIDPGSSVQVGEMVLAKIAAVTKQPVIAVFNTHIHGDHWLGNQAVKAAYPKAVIYAHPNMIEAVKSGAGDDWIKIMHDMTGGATDGTRAIVPDRGVNQGSLIKLGGMTFRIHHNGKAHTDGDIMIEAVEERVLFLGDNALNHRAARMDDSDIRGQIAILNIALRSDARHFVPGHGQSGGREVAERYQAFLKTLYNAVKKYYEQGLADFEMKDKVIADLAPYRGWGNFDLVIGKAISTVYLQVEAELF